MAGFTLQQSASLSKERQSCLNSVLNTLKIVLEACASRFVWKHARNTRLEQFEIEILSSFIVLSPYNRGMLGRGAGSYVKLFRVMLVNINDCQYRL